MSPITSFKISSGVIPFSSISVTELMLFTLSSNLFITSSSANGISWTINPPACFTVLSFDIKTPNPTAEGTCSDDAK